MTGLTYNQLMNDAVRLYHQGRYQEAYELVTMNTGKVEGNQAQIYNFRFCLASRAGHQGLAMSIIREAVIDRGYWYSYENLLTDDDLAPIRDIHEFKRMAEICKGREAEARSTSRPGMDIAVSQDEAPTTLLMILHGNEENEQIARSQWIGDGGPCCLMAFPRSSQIGFSGAYYWNDVELGMAEVRSHLRDLRQYFPVQSVVLAGFSAGARVALHLALDAESDVQGLILIAPWLPDLDEISSQIRGLRSRDVRCNIIWGGQDQDCREHSKALNELFEIEGVRHRKVEIPEMEHDVPSDLQALVPSMLAFIMEK